MDQTPVTAACGWTPPRRVRWVQACRVEGRSARSSAGARTTPPIEIRDVELGRERGLIGGINGWAVGTRRSSTRVRSRMILVCPRAPRARLWALGGRPRDPPALNLTRSAGGGHGGPPPRIQGQMPEHVRPLGV